MSELISRSAQTDHLEYQDVESTIKTTIPDGETQIDLFKKKSIRKIMHDDEWYYSVIDVVEAISQSKSPKRYWSDLKKKMTAESGGYQPYENIVRLNLPAEDKKMRLTDCANVRRGPKAPPILLNDF